MSDKISRFDVSNDLFARASEVIPLACQTYSKSHQQWVRGASPLFLDKGKGCRVDDPDGNSYIDYVLGLLPVVLGYGDPDVDGAIVAQLAKGISFSLASPLELELAELLRERIPCAEMVRFGKNGSDATTAAIRLARAQTGRDKVIALGYHGWHDWYIGTTTRHLGVPQAVRDLSVTLPFGNEQAVEDLLRRDGDQFAAIILEPTGAHVPPPGYLERLRELTCHYGIVLIFDEIITGFRIARGGAQERLGVVPDLACFGKAMANGMPISAVVGSARLMRGMEDIFFSGTFGGEALSLAAAIATIRKLDVTDGINRLWRRGAALVDGANAVLERRGLGSVLQFGGEGWWPRLKMTAPPQMDGNLMTSLFRQSVVAEGLLIGSSFNLCLAHDAEGVFGETLERFNRAMAELADALEAPNPASRLRGMPVQPTFAVR